MKIERRSPNPLKRTESEKSVEEVMDPPSYTRKILKDELNVSDKDVDKYLKILGEKAAVITKKLSNSVDSENEPSSPLMIKQ